MTFYSVWLASFPTVYNVYSISLNRTEFILFSGCSIPHCLRHNYLNENVGFLQFCVDPELKWMSSQMLRMLLCKISLHIELTGQQFYVFCIWLRMTTCYQKMLYQFHFNLWKNYIHYRLNNIGLCDRLGLKKYDRLK